MSDEMDAGRRELLARGALLLGATAAGGILGPGFAQAAEGTGRPPRFKDKAVLITGATSGIGEAAALAFAREGARIAFCGRRSEEGRRVEKAIRDSGGVSHFLRCDLRKKKELDRFFQDAAEKLGRIDIAVNNAGVESEPKPFHEVSDEDWESVVSLNTTAVFQCMRHEIRLMLRQKGGVIVNVASVHEHRGPPMIPAYVASKYATVGISHAAAMEFASQNIRINSLSPGQVNTAMLDRTARYPRGIPKERMAMNHAAGRLGEPEEIAQAMLWLASADASFVHGADLRVDGGYWRF